MEDVIKIFNKKKALVIIKIRNCANNNKKKH